MVIPRRRRVKNVGRIILIASATLFLLQTWLAGSTLDLLRKDKRAVVLTAHPDDEAMFFAPAILWLVHAGVQVYALCLSSGNADNLGSKRTQELVQSYAILGVSSPERIKIVEDLALQDGMQTKWDPQRIVEHVHHFAQESGGFDMLVTFDDRGISSHPNHKACSEASRYIDSDLILKLKSIPTLFKFFGLPQAISSYLHHRIRGHSNSIAFLSSPLNYIKALHAMWKHQSQLVWFRYLYVLFSSYMYGGTFQAIQQ